MNRIKMFAPVSMDGYVSRIDGDIDWTMHYLRDGDYGLEDFLGTIDSVVFNREYYLMLQSYDLKWQYGDLPCYVISRHSFSETRCRNVKLLPLSDGARLNDKVLLNELLKDKGTVWLAGNNELIATFLSMGLIDEVTLLVLPTTLGNGLPLARGSSGECRWALTDMKRYANGVLRLTYRCTKDT